MLYLKFQDRLASMAEQTSKDRFSCDMDQLSICSRFLRRQSDKAESRPTKDRRDVSTAD